MQNKEFFEQNVFSVFNEYNKSYDKSFNYMIESFFVCLTEKLTNKKKFVCSIPSLTVMKVLSDEDAEEILDNEEIDDECSSKTDRLDFIASIFLDNFPFSSVKDKISIEFFEFNDCDHDDENLFVCEFSLKLKI